MKLNRKIVIISVSVAIVAAIIIMLVSHNRKKPPEWKTAKVDKGNIVLVVTATGTMNPLDTVDVGAQVSGIIKALYVDFDSIVQKGQVIALLDTTLLYASLLDAKAAVNKARSQLELQTRSFRRIDTLFRQEVSSQNDYDQANAGYKAAIADLESANAHHYHEKTNLQYATIRAPINGTVISRNTSIGKTVISSFNSPSLFTIAKDLTKMQVFADVDEADIGQVKAGQPTEFTVDAYPYDTFRGKVAQVRIHPIMVQNVNNYIVVINVPNPDLKLLPGMTATITIKVQEHDSVLKVPGGAIRFTPPDDYLESADIPDSVLERVETARRSGTLIPKQGNYYYIWIKKESNLIPKRVRAGLFDGAFLEISGDIKEGEEVVTGTINSKKSKGGSKGKNPFMPQMPSRREMR